MEKVVSGYEKIVLDSNLIKYVVIASKNEDISK